MDQLSFEENINKVILSMFDVKKLKNACNFPSCNKKPEKKILVYEYSIKRRRDLISLYLCKEHFGSINKLLRKIRQKEPKIIIGTDIKNL